MALLSLRQDVFSVVPIVLSRFLASLLAACLIVEPIQLVLSVAVVFGALAFALLLRVRIALAAVPARIVGRLKRWVFLQPELVGLVPHGGIRATYHVGYVARGECRVQSPKDRQRAVIPDRAHCLSIFHWHNDTPFLCAR